VILVYAAITAAATGAALNMQPFGVLVRDGRLVGLQDFAAHRGFACAVWSGDAARSGGTSAYTLAAHLDATARWAGMAALIALPFGYSPTMVWLLGPFCAIPLRPAFVMWVVVGLVATIAAVIRSRAHWWTLVVLLNPVVVYSIILGQTAILSTAAFVFLIAVDATVGGSTWGTGIVVWLLTAKPPLAVTGAAVLVVRRRWRALAIAVALTIVSTAVVAPWLGAGWVHDYVTMLHGYDRVHLPAEFSWSIVPESMSNLRAALSADLGVRDDVAVGLANIAWTVSLAAVCAFAWKRRRDGGLTWSLAILVYLLFCPHVSATEDLALLGVLIALEGRMPAAVALGAIGLAFVGLQLSPALGPLAHRRPSLLFFAKLALVALVLAETRRRDRPAR